MSVNEAMTTTITSRARAVTQSFLFSLSLLIGCLPSFIGEKRIGLRDGIKNLLKVGLVFYFDEFLYYII